jgi:putative peptide zinc metalloprotease protein
MTTPSPTYAVGPLSIVPEGDEFLVGDVERGEFVLLPPIGIEVIHLLESGRSVREVEDAIGAEVDIPDFVATLEDLGFIRPGASVPRPTARAARRSWLLQVLFSRGAWLLYACTGVLTTGLIVYRPSLFPTYRDIFFLPSPVFSIACITLLMYLLAGLHEVCHWAGARAAGLQSRMTVSRRLYFLAFETDLTRLWALPRRERYGPLLAGMAFDTVVLCGATVVRLGAGEGWLPLAPEVSTFLGALAFTQIAALAAQCYVFMRTDVYAVLITATGCVNLWRVNQLRLLRIVRPLNAAQQHELATAHPRDLQIARWYSGLYVAGVALASAFFVAYFLPATVRLFTWMLDTVMAAQTGSLDFWAAIVFGVIVLSPRLLTVAVLARDASGYVWRRA